MPDLRGNLVQVLLWCVLLVILLTIWVSCLFCVDRMMIV